MSEVSMVPTSRPPVVTSRAFSAPFEIIERFDISGPSITETDFYRLDERVCDLTDQQTLCIQISNLADVATFADWLNTCIRYGHFGWENFLISSTDPEILARAQSFQSALRTGLILESRIDPKHLDSLPKALRFLDTYCVLPSIESLCEALLARAFVPELKVFVRIGRSCTEAISALRRGADGLVTDQPGRMSAAVAQEQCRRQTFPPPTGL